MSFRKNIRLVRMYWSSRFRSRANADLFRNIETFTMFVGYPRSGHSLIGSLLDAHPNILIAHELHALKLIQSGFDRNQLFQLLMENSRAIAAKGRRHSGYSYEVPNQWQGRFTTLKVIGDKRGASSAGEFRTRPGLLVTLKQTLNMDLKLIHVIRNPYDVLTTMSRRKPHKSFEFLVDAFFRLCESVSELKKQHPPASIYDLRLETFIEDPRLQLERLCSFVGVESYPDYLEDCARVVFDSPKKSRFDLRWTQENKALVKARMSRFDFLDGYSFD
jgi:hypothetical protein